METKKEGDLHGQTAMDFDNLFFKPDQWISEIESVISERLQVVRQSFRPICVLCDRKASIFPAPVVYDSPASALRQLKYAAEHGRDPNTGSVPLFAQYPEDFYFSCVGLYNSNGKYILASKDLKHGVDVCVELAAVLGKENK